MSGRPEDIEDGDPTEYGIRQFPYASERTSVDEKELRDHYGWMRGYYKARPSRYLDVQRWLNQGRYGISYDVYLARSAVMAVGAAAAGIVFAVAVTWALVESGVVAGIRNPLNYRGDLVFYLAEHRTLFSGALLVIAFAAIFGIGTWYLRYYYPRLVVDQRKRNIDVTLPHAITFMYALSRGGMDLLEVMEVLAENEGTYGEIANESEMVVREVQFFGNDLYTALQNVRNLTPSESFEQFLDDVLGVLDSGGDFTVFFEEEASEYLEDARDQQHSFLETLAILSEFFVAMFVAAPLFLIVILVVMSLLGGETVGQLSLIIYAVLPLSMAGFLVLLDTMSEPYRQPAVRFEDDQQQIEHGLALVGAVVRDAVPGLRARPVGVAPGELSDKQWRYLRHRRRVALRESLGHPLSTFRETPLSVLVVSVPLGIAVGAVALAVGLATPTQEAMVAEPIGTTTWLIAAPLIATLTPLSYFHERKRARERYFAKRFPDTLSVLASANKMGIQFVDALSLVARWSSGTMATEMQTLRNDLRWNYDTRGALHGLADRVGIPQLSRTMTLIAEGVRSSSDVAAVLSIAARDTNERFKLDRERRQELTPYIAVVVIGFLVFLLVVVMLDSAYLTPIAEAQAQQAQQPEPTRSVGSGLPLSLTNVPVDTYRTLFLHAAIIQALGSGILAGKLAEDDTLSGLKYSIALVIVAIAAFTLV